MRKQHDVAMVEGRVEILWVFGFFSIVQYLKSYDKRGREWGWKWVIKGTEEQERGFLTKVLSVSNVTSLTTQLKRQFRNLPDIFDSSERVHLLFYKNKKIEDSNFLSCDVTQSSFIIAAWLSCNSHFVTHSGMRNGIKRTPSIGLEPGKQLISHHVLN